MFSLFIEGIHHQVGARLFYTLIQLGYSSSPVSDNFRTIVLSESDHSSIHSEKTESLTHFYVVISGKKFRVKRNVHIALVALFI